MTLRLMVTALAVTALFVSVEATARSRTAGETSLVLTRLDKAPKRGRRVPTAKRLAKLTASVDKAPDDRENRFDLVRGLMAAGDFPKALVAAKAWRTKDAYNLVVVRLIGDIHTEMGDLAAARRAYSAVVELLPEDASAHRALATVLKQAGEIKGAYDRLVVAQRLKPEDVRIAFELADVAHRLGRGPEATALFEAIVKGAKTPRNVRYPAKQRLAQLLANQMRDALARKDQPAADVLDLRIAALKVKGGVVNDIKVYLSWDTDRSDVDLWVVNPAGEKVYYSHKRGRYGGALFDDVTSGYGPESFTAKRARTGAYVVKVHYYASDRRRFTAARGEVVVVLHEGTPQEERHVLPYRLHKAGDVVAVARIKVQSKVGGAK